MASIKGKNENLSKLLLRAVQETKCLRECEEREKFCHEVQENSQHQGKAIFCERFIILLKN